MQYLIDVQKSKGFKSYLESQGVKEYKHFAGVDDYYQPNMAVVAMERLVHLKGKQIKSVDNVIDFLANSILGYNAEFNWYNTVGIKIPKELEEAISVIRKAKSRSPGYGVDLHDENMMLRGNQLVITDPLA